MQMIRPIHLAAVVLLAACGSQDREPSAARADSSASIAPPSTAARTVEDDTLIRPAAPKYAYTLLDSATADVDGDGAPERVDLAATVEIGDDGQPLWDDGHTRMVAVRAGAETYPLIERFVSWGGAPTEESAPPAHEPRTRGPHSDSGRRNSANPTAPDGAGPVGAGRHHVFLAAISIAGDGSRPGYTSSDR
jgi:hypothetical protein